MIKQTGTVAIVKNAVPAGTQQKSFLNNVEYAVYRTDTGKGAEIFAFVIAFAAIFPQRRILGFDIYHQMRKSLVIFQQNIIFRFQLLNQLIFHQQRLGLILDDDKLHPPDFGHHTLQPERQPVDMGIIDDSLFDILGLADIQNLVVSAQHPINARFFRRNLNMLL